MKLGCIRTVRHKGLVRRGWLRARLSSGLQWVDSNTREVFMTSSKPEYVRTYKHREQIVEWIDSVTGKDIEQRTRDQITRLAAQNGLTVRDVMSLVLER